MAECKACGKELNQEASEIGSWCIDCIKNMADTNADNIAGAWSMFKKQWIIITIFSAIGAIGGIIAEISMGAGMTAESVGSMIGLIWGLGGLGAGFGYFVNSFAFNFKMDRAEGATFGEALKSTLLFGLLFLVLGIFGGFIFILVVILRRVLWMKKCSKIIAGEEETIRQTEDYLAGKQANKAELSENVCQIAANYELAHEGVSINILKKLRARK